MQQRKMVLVLKITIVLVICSIFVACRKDKVFCVMCEIGLRANNISGRSFSIFRGLWSMSDIVSCFGLCADTSSLDGVLCNRCKTPL